MKVKKWAMMVVLGVSVIANVVFGKSYWEATKVIEVIDGDTFRMKNERKVRLLGIDTPELGDCGSEEAKAKLTDLIDGKRVVLTEKTGETYGRIQALVYVGDTLVNKVMLEEGWARTDYKKNSHREEMTAVYHEAKNSKRGVFGMDCSQVEPESKDCVIKGNIDADRSWKIYHLPECTQYKSVIIDLDRGEKWFCSEEEAIEAGFRKSGECE